MTKTQRRFLNLAILELLVLLALLIRISVQTNPVVLGRPH